MLARSTPFALATLALLTSACASYIDKPYQQIHVATPGAQNAECVLNAGKSKAIAHPPQKVTIRNNNKPLNVTCHAPGNRVRHVSYPFTPSKSAGFNIANGYFPGMYYDHVERSLYKYPEQIVVDFKGIKARPNSLPQYQYATAPAPRDAGIENFGPGRSLRSWEELSRSSSKNPSSDSKNGQSEGLRAPVPLPETKDKSDMTTSKQGQRYQPSAEPAPQDTKADTAQNRSGQEGATASETSRASDTVSTVSPTRIKPDSRGESSRNSRTTRTPSSFEERARQDARSANQKQPQSGRRENSRAIDKPTRLYSGD